MAIQKYADVTPGRPAVAMTGSGLALSFAELDGCSARFAAVLRNTGLASGDRIAVLMENRPEFLIAVWAARRAELRVVPVNWHLTAEEASYIVRDSDAKVIVTSASLGKLAENAAREASDVWSIFGTDGGSGTMLDFHAAMGNVEPMPLAQSREGGLMAYSSGTSGRPKGILRPLDDRAFGEPIPFEMLMRDRYGIGEDSIYLTPAPLYHTAPIGWTMGAQALGATTAVMEQFDAEATLRAIETHRVTHAQFVPTHFVRMLKLPEAVRGRYDLSSLRVVLHSAAPCPPDVKDAMIDWLGPIIEEYYGGSEGGGFFTIGSEEWRRHRGSVGRPLPGLSHETRAGVHIVDPESGALLPVGEIGVIYFEGVARFDYHKAPEQTAQFFNAKGWGTLGDMGWLDDEGYLHLADRLSQMIISGGVNIYPQEIEAALALHPAVLDVAVIGVPNEEFGEEVKALVQPVGTADEKLRAELADYCRERLAGFKCPRSIDFVTELPRLANGKLLKRKLREPFWPNAQGRI